MKFPNQPRGDDGRFAEKPEVGVANRLTAVLREALGYDGSTRTESTGDLRDRLEAQQVAPMASVADQLIVDVERAVTVEDLVPIFESSSTVEAAGDLMVSGLAKNAPGQLVADCLDLLATETKDWNPRDHPRDKLGRFASIGAIVSLLDAEGGGGGSGQVIGTGDNGHIRVRKADGSVVDVAAKDTEVTQAAPGDVPGAPEQLADTSVGQAGQAATFGGDKPKPDAAPKSDRDVRSDLSARAKAEKDPAKKAALRAASAAVGAKDTDWGEAGARLHQRDQPGDQKASIAEMRNLADELEEAGVPGVPDALRAYADGYDRPIAAPIGSQEATLGQVHTLMDAMKKGGFTYHPGSETFKAEGFAVAVPGKGKSFEPGAMTRDDVRAYVKDNWADLEANPGLHIGGWMEDDGTTWLDLPEVFDDKDEAYAAGEERGELAIADLAAYANGDDGAIPIDYGKAKPLSGPALERYEAALASERGQDGGSEKPEGGAGANAPEAGGDAGAVRGETSGRDAGERKPKADEVVLGEGMDGQPTAEVPGSVADAFGKIAVPGRPDGEGTVDDPIDVEGDLDRAVELLAEGKHVRLNQVDEVATLLDKLRARVDEAKDKGEKAEPIDLCQVSVPGTNLFCHDHKGIPRAQMPQLSGTAVKGSAAELKADDKGQANIEPEYREALKARGIDITSKRVPASHLRATQSELDGIKVSMIARAMDEGKVEEAPIFVTRDGYVIDGHHRWAANLSRDVGDNELGDIDMPVNVLDMDVGAAIDFANEFAARMGIESQGLAARPPEGAAGSQEAPGESDLRARLEAATSESLRASLQAQIDALKPEEKRLFSVASVRFNPRLHPRDHRGRFIDTPNVTLPDGSTGRAVSVAKDGSINVRKPGGAVVPVKPDDLADNTQEPNVAEVARNAARSVVDAVLHQPLATVTSVSADVAPADIRGRDRLEILDSIARVDPEGREREPTARDRQMFQDWILERYGADIRREYNRGGWRPENDILSFDVGPVAPDRPLHAIGDEIRRDWKKPYFGAVPYIDALQSLGDIDDNYGADPGRSIVAYFLANAGTWRGETARRVKAELRALMKRPRGDGKPSSLVSFDTEPQTPEERRRGLAILRARLEQARLAEEEADDFEMRYERPDLFDDDEPDSLDSLVSGDVARDRPLHSIADEIRRDWKKPNFAAVPYLDAMQQLDSIDDPYYEDSGDSIVAYFLSNAGQWRGDTARRVKAELRDMLKRKRSRRDPRVSGDVVAAPSRPRGLVDAPAGPDLGRADTIGMRSALPSGTLPSPAGPDMAISDTLPIDQPRRPALIEVGGEIFTRKHSLWWHLVDDGEGGWTLSPERRALHDQIVADSLDGVPESTDPTFYMLGGGPASGKSTMLRDPALADVPDDDGVKDGKKTAVVVNPDNVKVVLPEYQERVESGRAREAAPFVHEESSIISKRIQSAALDANKDTLLDGTGDSSEKKLMRKINQARRAGFKVKGYYATIPTDEAWARADKRAKESGRIVPEPVLRSIHASVSEVFPKVWDDFDEVTLFDTRSWDGAKIIAIGAGQKLTVTDPEQYEAFLAKAQETA